MGTYASSGVQKEHSTKASECRQKLGENYLQIMSPSRHAGLISVNASSPSLYDSEDASDPLTSQSQVSPPCEHCSLVLGLVLLVSFCSQVSSLPGFYVTCSDFLVFIFIFIFCTHDYTLDSFHLCFMNKSSWSLCQLLMLTSLSYLTYNWIKISIASGSFGSSKTSGSAWGHYHAIVIRHFC